MSRGYLLTTYLSIALLSMISCKENNSNDLGTEEQIVNSDKIEIEESDYTDDIEVVTIQIGGESSREKNKLQISYPRTSLAFINNTEKEYADRYKAEFENEVSKSNESAVSGITFLRHFDILQKTDSLLVFLIEENRSFGNNFDDRYFTRYYDLVAKREITIDGLFKSKAAFQKFSSLVRNELKRKLKSEIYNNNKYSENDKKLLWEGLEEQIELGTEARSENYHAIEFFEGKKVTIRFNKYQVAPGYMGTIDVDIPIEEVRAYINDDYKNLLHIKKKKATEEPLKSINPDVGINVPIGVAKQPVVALTFDDGPSVHTQRLLDILKVNDVKATFFVLGKSAKIQKNTVRRAYNEGHQIANHSWNHKNLTKVSDEELRNQVFNTNEVVENITDKKPSVLRPPYGAINAAVKIESGMPIILWNLDPLDWKDKNTEIVAERMSEARANGIILAHDIHKTTVDAIPTVIKNLRAKGYDFVTIDEMFADKDLDRGMVYSHK